MSNHLAIAAVTATLVQLLEAAVQEDFPGAHAIAGRPDAPAGQDADPEIRVFLYRVSPNSAWRNLDLPIRNTEGSLVDVPQVAIDLHYLLTFTGNEADFAPQRLLGIAVRTLHFHPLLTRVEIGRMVQAEGAELPPGPLVAADLDQQPDLVRFAPEPVTLDELSNLWSSFFEAEYRLSVTYRASVVLLTQDVAPIRALPVRERRLFVATLLRPQIRSVRPVAGDGFPILPGSTIEIAGSQLQGDEITVVRIGAAEATLAGHAASPSRIEVIVPATVRAGATGVVVEHRRMMGEPLVARPAGQSNVHAIVVHPVIRPSGGGHTIAATGVTTGAGGTRQGLLDVTIDPPIGARQQVAVILNSLAGGGEAFSFFDERRDGAGALEFTNALTVAFAGVPPGDYLVRVQVDGAESPLEVQTAAGPDQGKYTAPRVTIP